MDIQPPKLKKLRYLKRLYTKTTKFKYYYYSEIKKNYYGGLKMKKILSLFVIISLFALYGCSNNGGGTTKTTIAPYIGGSEALEFGFIADEPPEEVLDQEVILVPKLKKPSITFFPD